MMQTLQPAPYSKKAQLKIQQMAFVLVALMIFFGLIAVIYFSIWSSSIQKSSKQRQGEEASQIALAMAGTPEFAFTSSSDCSSCIDFEKLVAVSQNEKYKNLWNLDYLEIEIVYPKPSEPDKECKTAADLTKCGKITIIPKPENFGSAPHTFVSLVRRAKDTNGNGYFKYEIAKIIASGGNAPND